jgi:hypothetical protein
MEFIREAAPAWNFFRKTDAPDLWCAVPVDRSVPDFLLSGAWGFGGHRMNPGGFRLNAALNAEGLNGFYLFQRVPETGSARGEVSRRP